MVFFYSYPSENLGLNYLSQVSLPKRALVFVDLISPPVDKIADHSSALQSATNSFHFFHSSTGFLLELQGALKEYHPIPRKRLLYTDLCRQPGSTHSFH